MMNERHLTLSILIATACVFSLVAQRVSFAHALGASLCLVLASFTMSVVFQRLMPGALSRWLAFLGVCVLSYHLSEFTGLRATK